MRLVGRDVAPCPLVPRRAQWRVIRRRHAQRGTGERVVPVRRRTAAPLGPLGSRSQSTGPLKAGGSGAARSSVRGQGSSGEPAAGHARIELTTAPPRRIGRVPGRAQESRCTWPQPTRSASACTQASSCGATPARGPLALVDQPDEVLRAPEVRAQLAHRRVREVGVRREQLGGHGGSMPEVSIRALRALLDHRRHARCARYSTTEGTRAARATRPPKARALRALLDHRRHARCARYSTTEGTRAARATRPPKARALLDHRSVRAAASWWAGRGR